MIIWQSMANIILTSLLSSLIVILIIIALSNIRFANKSLFVVMLSQVKIIFFSAIILALLIPVILSLLRGAWFSLAELGLYVKEWLVSIVIVVSFSITWKILNNSTSILDSIKGIFRLLERGIFSLKDHIREEGKTQSLPQTAELNESFIKLQIVIPCTLNEALQTWDAGKISQAKVEEIELLTSLNKWLEQADETGWHELKEVLGSNSWLQNPKMRSIINRALWRAQRDKHRNGKYTKQLKKYLNINSSFYSKFPEEERELVFKQILKSILSVTQMEHSHAN